MLFNFLNILLSPFLIFLFAVAPQRKSIFLNIKYSIDDTFKELFSFFIAIQIFAHAKEKVESFFQ